MGALQDAEFIEEQVSDAGLREGFEGNFLQQVYKRRCENPDEDIDEVLSDYGV